MAGIVGLISAAALPLGALTAFFWRPESRVVAALMAFGGGALLAALSIDLVAPVLHQEHYGALFAGFIAGGLMFIGLNLLVNDLGGFRRKISTSVHHSRLETRRQLRRIIGQLDRAAPLQGLSADEFRQLALDIEPQFYPRGARVFCEGDPSDALYVVVRGEIELRDERQRENAEPLPARRLGPDAAFGVDSLLTGSAHCLTAVATQPTWGWRVDEESVRRLLSESTVFQRAVKDWLCRPRIHHYLTVVQGLSEEDVQHWLDEALMLLDEEARLPDARPVERHADQFRILAPALGRMPWLEELSEEEADWLSLHLVYRRYERGDLLFAEGDPPDRLFIMEEAGVSLFDSAGRLLPSRCEAGDGVGVRAFLTGVRHTVSARVVRECGAWTLRREDFERLLANYPDIRTRLAGYLQGPAITDYLGQRYHLDAGRVQEWIGHAIKAVNQGKPVPGLLAEGVESSASRGASMAIWLGIFLDGIPESLVIGASLTAAGISPSLVVGIFLANYPEALSSARGMLEEGFGRRRILLMWTSIMVLTGIGAALGKLLMDLSDPVFFPFLEGLAAGAMLTMIAQTMLPEAYIKGGSLVGFCTLMGFFCAILTKAF
jgi:CRP-like cAMP-binding protein/zinc transporter ZupT